jgi:hypothetical protein
MQQLNTYRFYELGAKLHCLFDADAASAADLFAPLTEAQTLLDTLIKDEGFPLETSRADATKLLNKLGALFNRYFIDPATKQLKTTHGEERADAHEMAMLRGLVEKFEHAFAAELNRAPTYVAGKRGIYSTFDLAENARQIFGVDIRASVPAAALNEFDAAGRSLAFGLGTAAATHILRAVEVTLKPYFETYVASSAKAERNNYALYLKKLAAMADEEDRAQRPDKRVVQMLAQIKDHYRNPLTAPDQNVDLEEATQFFSMASALIGLMARRIGAAQTPADTRGAKPENSPESDDSMYDFHMAQAG